MRKFRLSLAMVLVLPILFACATPWQNQASSGYLGAISLATVAEQTVKPSCDSASLLADKCNQLKTIYGQIRQGCVAAGNTLILALKTSDKAQQGQLLATYQSLIADANTAVASYIALFQDLSKSGKLKATKYAMSPALLQIIVDAFAALLAQIPAIINAVQSWQLTSVDVNALVTQIQTAQAGLPVW